MPYEIHPSEPLATLFRTFKEVGGMIDYVLIGGITPEEFADPYAFHKIAAGFTIEAAILRYPRSQERGPASFREPDKAEGKQITPAEFFAPGYIGIPFEVSAYLTAEELEVERLKLDQDVFSNGEIGQFMHNHHYAFSYPPYNLDSLDGHAEEWLFPAINHELFGDDVKALTIYEWSTDWAGYFKLGDEWWGSFLWTVYSTETQQLVGIAASASD